MYRRYSKNCKALPIFSKVLQNAFFKLCRESTYKTMVNKMSFQFAPIPRKYMLTVHLIFSIGWFGAVAAFIVLACLGLTSRDSQQVRSSYIAMESIGWYAIVPFSVGALVTGVIQSLGTHWGLSKYYWVLAKLLLTAIGTGVLLLHMKAVSHLAAVASAQVVLKNDFRQPRIQLIRDAGGALLLLLAATVLSVIRPWGKIQGNSSDKPGKYLLITLVLLISLFIILHLTRGGLHTH